MGGPGKGSRLTERRFRQREQNDRGDVQAKGEDSRQREKTDRGEVKTKGTARPRES